MTIFILWISGLVVGYTIQNVSVKRINGPSELMMESVKWKEVSQGFPQELASLWKVWRQDTHTHTHTKKRTTTTKTSPECKNVINILYHLHVSMLSSNIQKPCLSKKVLLASCRYTARRCRATIWPTNFAPGHIVKEKHDQIHILPTLFYLMTRFSATRDLFHFHKV